MSNEIKNLTDRTKRAQRSTLEALNADLAEASRRMQTPGNPRIAEDTDMFNLIIGQLVKLNIDRFNGIVNSAGVRAAVDDISKSAAELKREAKKVKEIADKITKWRKRLDKAKKVVKKLRDLA